MRSTPPTEELDQIPEGAHPIEDLVSEGLLWLINSTTFWPRGYSLALIDNRKRGDTAVDAQKVVAFELLGDGTEPWLPSSEEVATKRFRAVESFISRQNKRTTKRPAPAHRVIEPHVDRYFNGGDDDLSETFPERLARLAEVSRAARESAVLVEHTGPYRSNVTFGTLS